MAQRNFERNKSGKYGLKERTELENLIKKYKEEYDSLVEENKDKVNYDRRLRQHTKILPRDGFIAKAVREFYHDLKEVKADDRKLVNALKLGKRCLAPVDQPESELSAPLTKGKYRQPGGGRKVAVPEVRKALYDWFIDMRGTLKARLPKSMFKAQAILLYNQWLAQQPEAPNADERIVFSNRWMNNSMTDYNVSLRKPNKR